MKNKWKIILSVLVSIGALFFILMVGGKDPTFNIEPQVPDPIHPSTETKVPDSTHSNIVDRLLDEMEFGAIAFNAPSNIDINESFQIQLLLSPAESVDKLKQLIVEEGEKIGTSIKVSDRMEAHLTGYMFEITSITSEIQAVSKNQLTEWKWDLHPKKEGKHSLHLTLTALLEVNGQSTPRTIRTFDKNIEVTVTKSQKFISFFKNNWQWLWAAIFVPIVGWLWKRKKSN